MDFKPGILQTFPLPFYMTYPGCLQQGRENDVVKDLEYLQQTYPGELRHYQNRIAEMLDKFDYEGGMIYDEYPDRDTIARLSETMTNILRREEAEQNAANVDDTEDAAVSVLGSAFAPSIIQVLLCNEICKRRHGGRRGFLKF